MFDILERAFESELRKEAFYAGLENELEKLGFLPAIAGGLLMGAAHMGLAAATKPKDVTWRGAGFTPSGFGQHLKDTLINALPGKKFLPFQFGNSLFGGPAQKPLNFKPPSVTAAPISTLGQKVVGSF